MTAEGSGSGHGAANSAAEDPGHPLASQANIQDLLQVLVNIIYHFCFSHLFFKFVRAC